MSAESEAPKGSYLAQSTELHRIFSGLLMNIPGELITPEMLRENALKRRQEAAATSTTESSK